MSGRPGAPTSGTEVVIGLDAGTTGVKAVAFALSAAGSSEPPWRHVALREYPLLEPEPGAAEQDPSTILAAAAAALTEAVQATGPARVLCVSLSAAMHGLVGLDQEARPVTPLITWADGRAWREAAELRRTEPGLTALTGAPVHPMTPLVKLHRLSRAEPALVRSAHWWVGLKELLLVWLTGQVISERSSASGSGLVALQSGEWAERPVSIAGLRDEQLPEIRSSAASLPLTAAAAVQVGLARGTPVVLGAGDGPLANLGTGATEPGVACLSLGTSGALRVTVSEPLSDPEGSLFCYVLTDGLWVTGGAISNGGMVVRWAEHALAPDLGRARDGTPDDALLALAATVAPGSEGLLVLPYLLAERAPAWDPSLPGAVLGLRRRHTRAHLIRATIEGVCLGLRAIADRLGALTPVDSVKITGGAFQAPLWRGTMAAALGRELQPAGEQEGTALGAAVLALQAIGRSESPHQGLDLLEATRGSKPPPVVPDPEWTEALRRQRATLPVRAQELTRLAKLF